MPRLAILASLAALTLGAAAASAQESGGVALTPEVLATENAQGRVLDHVLARAQQLQQLRLLNLSGGAAASSNLANPAVAPPNGDPLSLGTGQAGTLALASALRRRATKTSDSGFQQQIIDNSQSLTVNNSQSLTVNNSQSLTVNAHDSPVNIGNNNVVKQQVSTSTAISANGNATASAGASNTSNRLGLGKGKTKPGQTAVSNAANQGGGTAQAVAINSEVRPQGNR
jgi:hypothetical protein